MSKAFSVFYDYLLPELPGCTTKMLDLHLLLVAREVCDRAGSWLESLSPIDSEVDRTDYSLIAPVPKAEVSRVVRLSWSGQLQWAAKAIAEDSDVRPRYQPGEPPFGLNPAMDTITLAEQPEGEILIDAALRPTLASTTLPDLMLTQYLETVRVGVLSRFMRMGGKPWSNPQLSVRYDSDYLSALNRHAIGAGNGNTRAPMRAAPSRI